MDASINQSSGDVLFRAYTMTTAIAQMKARCLFRRPDFLKYVVFKVGIRGHICESYWRLSTLLRPPCLTATRMSRLSSWFTWSVLNVEVGKAAEVEH